MHEGEVREIKVISHAEVSDLADAAAESSGLPTYCLYVVTRSLQVQAQAEAEAKAGRCLRVMYTGPGGNATIGCRLVCCQS